MPGVEIPSYHEMVNQANNYAASGHSNASFKVTPPTEPPPEAPDMSELLAAYGGVPAAFNPARYVRGFDAAIGASRMATAQQGRNAGLAYSSRLQQMGVAPTAAGVVEAQARRAGNEQTRELMSEREQVALQARKEGMSLRASIAEKLAAIRDSYAKTVADYNARKAGFEFNASSVNAANALKDRELDMTEEELAARLGAAGGSPAAAGMPPVITPGYIPTFGPITPATVNGRILPGQVISPDAIAAMGYRIG